MAEAFSLSGCVGSTVLRRSEGAHVRFTLITIWSDEDALTAFARTDAAVHYPGDDVFGLVPDERATHHAVVDEKRTVTIGV